MEVLRRFIGYLMITGGVAVLIITLIGVVIIIAITVLLIVALLAGMSSM